MSRKFFDDYKEQCYEAWMPKIIVEGMTALQIIGFIVGVVLFAFIIPVNIYFHVTKQLGALMHCGNIICAILIYITLKDYSKEYKPEYCKAMRQKNLIELLKAYYIIQCKEDLIRVKAEYLGKKKEDSILKLLKKAIVGCLVPLVGIIISKIFDELTILQSIGTVGMVIVIVLNVVLIGYMIQPIFEYFLQPNKRVLKAFAEDMDEVIMKTGFEEGRWIERISDTE